MSNTAKNCDILAINLKSFFYIIILTVQLSQNYFQIYIQLNFYIFQQNCFFRAWKKQFSEISKNFATDLKINLLDIKIIT